MNKPGDYCYKCHQGIGAEGAEYHVFLCTTAATYLDQLGIPEGPERNLIWAGLMFRVNLCANTPHYIGHSGRNRLLTAALELAQSQGWEPPWARWKVVDWGYPEPSGKWFVLTRPMTKSERESLDSAAL